VEGPAQEPVPFWHGKLWEPLPVARWTKWATYDDNGAVIKSLNDTIREERARLRELPAKYLPYLRGLRDNIRHLIQDALQQPHHRVFRIHHERLVREIQCRIEELERNADLEEFEANVQPFILAHANALAAAAREQDDAERKATSALPASMIDAMAPMQQRLYRRMLAMISNNSMRSGAKEGPTEVPAGGSDVVSSEDLVRHMFSRLWVSSHVPSAMHTTAHDMCQRCKIPMTKSAREQLLVCSQCGFSFGFVDSTEAARTYGDDAEYYPNASTRFNHFQEFVTRVQARELKPVPRSVMAKVAVGLRDMEGVTCSADITLDKVVRVVNELGAPLREYKKNVVQICAQLSGRWPVQLTAEQMFMARSIFFEILNAFEVLFPGEKKKWFRYKFIMRVICFTMGWDKMLRALDAIEGSGAAEDDDEPEAGGPSSEEMRAGERSEAGHRGREVVARESVPNESVPKESAPGVSGTSREAPSQLPAANEPDSARGGHSFRVGAPVYRSPSTGDAAAAAPGNAMFRNIPRREMEDAELRMRAIFRQLGWFYRGPFTGVVVEEEPAPAFNTQTLPQ